MAPHCGAEPEMDYEPRDLGKRALGRTVVLSGFELHMLRRMVLAYCDEWTSMSSAPVIRRLQEKLKQ